MFRDNQTPLEEAGEVGELHELLQQWVEALEEENEDTSASSPTESEDDDIGIWDEEALEDMNECLRGESGSQLGKETARWPNLPS